ncbi:MAG: hypothetical protein FJ130_06395 [Deltaproteobacteria bacterium]|nr:hypothetical protein [Deltaproteobacteria bacterium]
MIIFTHHTGEPHGILGAQLAATFFQRKLSIPSIVVGIERNFSKERLFRFLDEHYAGKERVAAFSHLCGRKDLIELIRELKQKGFVTIIGGPQARQDYVGEPEVDSHPHRFRGLRSTVDLAFQGPVDGFRSEHLNIHETLFEYPWTKEISIEVDWSNLHLFSDTLQKHEVRLCQVLNAIGCPYSSKAQTVILPPPVDLKGRGAVELSVRSEGCIFCDVSHDKGFHDLLEMEQVIDQIVRLPELDGKKVPFELIDEYPLRSLGKLFEEISHQNIRLSQINLVCRVDDVNAHASDLPGILSQAQNQDIKVMFASIGFESFSDRLLQYFCKGITLSDIVECVETLRRLKDRFKTHFLYRRDEGANHGFIRPTPWDDGETMQEMDRNIFLHRFFEDILPEHSTPLIIHHASFLGDWIRKIESTTDIRFGRDGTWIEWWNPSFEGGT